MKIDYLDLQKHSDIFVSETMGNIDPQGKCFAVSFPLSVYLENINLNYESTITQGYYKEISKPHYWLTLNNNTSIIIDPTKSQFFKDSQYVFIGEKPQEYIATNKNFVNWIDETKTTWLNPFFYPQYNTHLNLDLLIVINIKSAIIINKQFYNLNLPLNNTIKSAKYFKGIFDIITNSQDKLSIHQNLVGFNELMFAYNKYYNLF